MNTEESEKLLGAGLNDESELVREASLEMIAEQPNDVRYALYKEGLKSSNEDVFSGIVSALEDESNHRAMDALIEGLRHSNADFREVVSDAIDFLVSETFESYEEAKAWWAANKNKYDDELFEKD